MKWLSTTHLAILGTCFAVLLASCGTVGQTIIPDYHVKQEIKKPFPPEVVITFDPTSYPKVCANAKTPNEQWYRTVTINVNLRNQDPAEVSLLINKSGMMESPVSLGHGFRYPAGAGRHNVEIWVKSDPIQYFKRSFTVYVCGPSSRKIEAYKP